MSPDTLPISPQDWHTLTPMGVCLGLLTVLVLVGIPLLIYHNRKDMSAMRAEFIASINQISARYESERQRKDAECATERDRMHGRFEASLREVTQSVRGGRRGSG